ncbi:MAG TPA: molybdenum cofactor biosynthesis protein MoaE [Dongiaceae bacterium]|jgi:molybdopterin synthase catalytic subunit|nr:molybdenum cofactor biosynthesis protein MoaE [Dongiaceae bacterium]
METHIEFTRSRIVPSETPLPHREVGAQVDFLGIVRELENGAAIPGLHYDAYETMARLQLGKILTELATAHPCVAVWFVHRLGFVPVGEASLFVRALARHRREALEMTTLLVERLKAEVPIWKLPPA